MVLTLYKLDASPPVRSVRSVLDLLEIENVELVDLNLLKGEHLKDDFLKLNPQHTIPTLVDDGFVVIDSHAIVGYLVAKYGKDDSLYPTDPKKRSIVDHRLHFDSSTLFPALRGAVRAIVLEGLKSISPEAIENIKTAYGFLDKFVTSTWLTGENLTVADVCCVTTISSLNVLVPIDKDAYPNMSAWLKRCSEQQFYKKGNEPGLEAFIELLKSKLI